MSFTTWTANLHNQRLLLVSVHGFPRFISGSVLAVLAIPPMTKGAPFDSIPRPTWTTTTETTMPYCVHGQGPFLADPRDYQVPHSLLLLDSFNTIEFNDNQHWRWSGFPSVSFPSGPFAMWPFFATLTLDRQHGDDLTVYTVIYES